MGQSRAARAVVFGYGDIGVRCLGALLDAGVEVPLVVTHRDPEEGNKGCRCYRAANGA